MLRKIFFNRKTFVSILVIIIGSTSIVASSGDLGGGNYLKGFIDGNNFQLDPVTSPFTTVGNLADESYTYVSADFIDSFGITPISAVHVAVIDVGLTEEQWNTLIDDPVASVNDITYYTYINNQVVSTTTPSDVSTYGEDSDRDTKDHGFFVSSIIAAVAGSVKLSFFDMKWDADTNGFDILTDDLWTTLVDLSDNPNNGDLDVLTMSLGWSTDFKTTNIDGWWDDLNNNGVYMLNSAGNANTLNPSARYPKVYDQWTTIGSIDHEDRYKDDNDQNLLESIRGERSGEGDTSWGTNTFNTGSTVDERLEFLMPAHWMPSMHDPTYNSQTQKWEAKWRYNGFTSGATPYLAAVVALMYSEYSRGYDAAGVVDPNIDTIEAILVDVSTDGIHSVARGYGTIDVEKAIRSSYWKGFIDANNNIDVTYHYQFKNTIGGTPYFDYQIDWDQEHGLTLVLKVFRSTSSTVTENDYLKKTTTQWRPNDQSYSVRLTSSLSSQPSGGYYYRAFAYFYDGSILVGSFDFTGSVYHYKSSGGGGGGYS